MMNEKGDKLYSFCFVCFGHHNDDNLMDNCMMMMMITTYDKRQRIIFFYKKNDYRPMSIIEMFLPIHQWNKQTNNNKKNHFRDNVFFHRMEKKI